MLRCTHTAIIIVPIAQNRRHTHTQTLAKVTYIDGGGLSKVCMRKHKPTHTTRFYSRRNQIINSNDDCPLFDAIRLTSMVIKIICQNCSI